MSIGLRWAAQSTMYRDTIDILAYRDGNRMEVVKPVAFEFEVRDRNSIVSEPTIGLVPQSAQSLMQALWDAGVRPHKLDGSPEQIAALKDHVKFAEYVARTCLESKS